MSRRVCLVWVVLVAVCVAGGFERRWRVRELLGEVEMRRRLLEEMAVRRPARVGSVRKVEAEPPVVVSAVASVGAGTAEGAVVAEEGVAEFVAVPSARSMDPEICGAITVGANTRVLVGFGAIREWLEVGDECRGWELVHADRRSWLLVREREGRAIHAWPRP